MGTIHVRRAAVILCAATFFLVTETPGGTACGSDLYGIVTGNRRLIRFDAADIEPFTVLPDTDAKFIGPTGDALDVPSVDLGSKDLALEGSLDVSLAGSTEIWNSHERIYTLDYVTWAANYGDTPPSNPAAPEPATLGLLALGAVALTIGRRCRS